MSIPDTHRETTNDHADLNTIASLLLEEVGEVKASHKNKGREDAPSTDDVVAFDLFADELRSLLLVIQDGELARSMVEAVSTDHAVGEEMGRNDAWMLEDRSIAVRMNRDEDISRLPSGSVMPRGISATRSGAQTPQANSKEGIGSSGEATDGAAQSPCVSTYPQTASTLGKRYVYFRNISYRCSLRVSDTNRFIAQTVRSFRKFQTHL